MNYKLIKKFNGSVFMLSIMFLGLISCYDSGYEEFVPPTGNVNNIQPNTLFTTSLKAGDNLSVVFRSYSTDATSYLWDFGDGNTSTEANPNYKYEVGGEYTVTLKTTSADGLVAEASAIVAPIFVGFNFTTEDSEVIFENLTNGAKKLVWDFGDGNTVEWNAEDTQNNPDFSPVHIYATADTFKVTLTATNYLDIETSVTKSIEGLVLSTVPDFTFSVSTLKVDFTDASLLAVSHSWDFGDGTSSTELNPTHTYAVKGIYDVKLTTTNDAGVSKSVTKAVPVGGVEASFKAIVLNGTADTSDISDWNMIGTWTNSALDGWLSANTGDSNQQPGSTSDGSYVDGVKTRGLKLYSPGRRLYQVVTVEVGVEYTFTIDSRSEAEGINTDVFILNTEITSETSILDNADAYFEITNDFNTSKGSASENTFTTNTFTFKPSTNQIVIYVRSPNAVDSNTEVFFDNIDIITPGF